MTSSTSVRRPFITKLVLVGLSVAALFFVHSILRGAAVPAGKGNPNPAASAPDHNALDPEPDAQPPLPFAGPDRTVGVESPGSKRDGKWQTRPTRTLEGLANFVPGRSPSLDRCGGRLDQPAAKATGFFRTEKIEGRWWFITPEGHRYWNVGINMVRSPSGVPASENQAYAERATGELRSLGFNGLGSRVPPEWRTVSNPLPWCLRLDFAATFAREYKQTYRTGGHVGFTNRCVPTFHPDFPAWAMRYAQVLKSTVSDPSIIGIFTDNELQCSADLLDRHLALDPADGYHRHGREAAVAWLKARGKSDDPKGLTKQDRYEFVAYVLATYSRIVHEAVRSVDQNHLVLGSRFHVHVSQFDNPAFWAAVGPWMDVVSANYYWLWGPQASEIQAWSQAAQKPVILTEWYAKALDAPGLSNALGAGWTVRTQADRGLYYQHFLLNALETPALVGVHYYKYLDDPSNSSALDSAGGANKGLYTADGRPWTILLDRAGAVNREVYPLIDLFDRRRKGAPKQNTK